ncbi:MAG: hypothetical protein Q7S59_05905 [Sulfurimonas sp.]|nr:hypothetical protein [Sulfurimonas sp.]
MAENITTTELELALQNLAEQQGLSVVEYVQSLGYATASAVETSVSGLQAQITSIVELDSENGVESLAEKIKAINSVITDENGVVQSILTKILENRNLITNETARATNAELVLNSKIDANKSATDTLAEIVASNLTATDLTASELQAQIDTLSDGSTASTEALVGRVTVIEDSFTDKQVGDVVQKGYRTRISDLESGVSAETEARIADIAKTILDAKAYSDANNLKASTINVCSVANSFRRKMGLADITCSGSSVNGTDGVVI